MSHQPLARPIRSLLFAPANRPELIEKFPRYRADVFAIDLEDGTPEAEKASARRDLPRVIDVLRDRGVTGAAVRPDERVAIAACRRRSRRRPRDADRRHHHAEARRAADLERFSQALSRAEARTGRPLRLIGTIETAAGVLNVDAIASCGDAHLCGSRLWRRGFHHRASVAAGPSEGSGGAVRAVARRACGAGRGPRRDRPGVRQHSRR